MATTKKTKTKTGGKASAKKPSSKKAAKPQLILRETEISVSSRLIEHMSYRFDADEAFDYGLPNDDGNYIVDVSRIPACHVDEMLTHSHLLGSGSKAKLITFLVGDVSAETYLEREVASIREMGYVLQAIQFQKKKGPNVELNILNRWYPVRMEYRYWQSMFGETLQLTSTVALSATGEHVDIRRKLTSSLFYNEAGNAIRRTISSLFDAVGMRPLRSNADTREHDQRALAASELGTHHGRQVLVTGTGVCKDNSWFSSGLEEVRIGTPNAPRRAIIEPELELDHDSDDDDDDDCSVLPFVRVFSMDVKRYVYIDIQDVIEYVPDARALDRLVLPSDVQELVSRLFQTHVDDLFGDILNFKHGGMIICAEGPTGVGKTLTAECFAEHSGRPLYPIELGELSTKIDEIESRLRLIFMRAKRWNAVLLFDEADVLFQKRDDNLERSAIVGIFLRLLDYYNGFLFLTTNRLDVMDPAFESRITLTLKYDELDQAKRFRVWSNMFDVAKMSVPAMTVAKLSTFKTNGRQIRSMVRLAKSFFGIQPTLAQLEGIVVTQVRNASREEASSELLNLAFGPTAAPGAPVAERRDTVEGRVEAVREVFGLGALQG